MAGQDDSPEEKVGMEHLRCQRCGALYRIISGAEAQASIVALGNPDITLEDFRRCRLCHADVATFEPWQVYRNPLSGVLPPTVQRLSSTGRATAARSASTDSAGGCTLA